MGIFDFFGKESSEERFVNRQVKKLLNKYLQKELREEAIYSLAQRGTPKAIQGLLQRFTYDHPDSIIDEKEKQLVLDLLERLGPELSVPQLKIYLKDPRQNFVSMALIAFERLTSPEETLQEITELLKDSDPHDAWSRDRKLQLIGHIAELELKSLPEELLKQLIRFLDDLDDDVIFKALDLLDQYGKDELIREPILELFAKEETSMRIRSRILDMVRSHKWYIGDRQKEFEPLLPEGYYFDKRGNIKYRQPTY